MNKPTDVTMGNQQASSESIPGLPEASTIIESGPEGLKRVEYGQAAGSAKRMERFWSKTEAAENGCIVWKACKNGWGYGVFAFSSERKYMLAHRVAWLFAGNGEVPEGKILRHKCDNPACVNVEHLILGAQADNIADKVERNRQAKGVKHGMSKLSEDQVREIRTLKGTGKEIGKRFGISAVMVNYIRSGKSWAHVR